MKTSRPLAAPIVGTATTVVLALGLSACGSDDGDDVAATSTSAPAPSESAPAPSDAAPVDPSATPRDDDGDVMDAELRAELEKIALDEVGRGRVSDVEYSDDRSHAYEVDVELGNDDDVTVEIAEDKSVVRVDR